MTEYKEMMEILQKQFVCLHNFTLKFNTNFLIKIMVTFCHYLTKLNFQLNLILEGIVGPVLYDFLTCSKLACLSVTATFIVA